MFHGNPSQVLKKFQQCSKRSVPTKRSWTHLETGLGTQPGVSPPCASMGDRRRARAEVGGGVICIYMFFKFDLGGLE